MASRRRVVPEDQRVRTLAPERGVGVELRTLRTAVPVGLYRAVESFAKANNYDLDFLVRSALEVRINETSRDEWRRWQRFEEGR